MPDQHLESPRRRLVIMALAIAVMGPAAGIALGLILPARQPAGMTALTVLPEPRVIAEFDLLYQDGRPFNLARLHGRWSLLFFGFTHCPDVCPARCTTSTGSASSCRGRPAIMRLRRSGWTFTVMFSNTEAAHRLGKTDDWVVVYAARGGAEQQCTVVTETRGRPKGRRVVRGHEAESEASYRDPPGVDET